MKGEYRDELPRIVNAVVDSYMDEIVSDKVARLRQKDLLAQHYSAKQESFRVKMDKWKKLARELRASSSEAEEVQKNSRTAIGSDSRQRQHADAAHPRRGDSDLDPQGAAKPKRPTRAPNNPFQRVGEAGSG